MSRIEELPDDFEENLNLKDHPKADSNGPSLPLPSQAANGTAAQTSASAMAFPAKPDDIPLDPFAALAAMPPSMSNTCLLYTSPSPRDGLLSRMPSSA